MARPRKGLSYVLGDTSEKENHILPINAMQLSKSRQQLYTAGRDGAVKVWDAMEQASSPSPGDYPIDYEEDSPDLAETILKLETSLSSSPLDHILPISTYDPRRTKSYNVHFDWVNDLKLVNNDRHLVSASADLSLKLIDIEGDERHVQKFQNIHTDYVKKVSSIPLQNSLISGGLDGKVVVWDMSRLVPISNFQNNSTGLNFTSSIYSLSNDNGHLISAGGPNNTINLYDKRISSDSNANLIRKLVGHQDNVRCLLMNSKYILSGSSDSTIKLWDLRTFNVYKSFDAHDDAVWSLCTGASSDPCSTSITDFKEFYSGDRAGNIIKTDLNFLSTHSKSDTNEQVFESTFSCSDQAYIDEQIGICTLVAKASSPIFSLCVEGENSLFASCDNSLKRYNIPMTKSLAKYQYLRAYQDHSDCIEGKCDDDLSQGIESVADQSDLNSDFYDIISHLSTDSANLDIASSISGVSHAFLPLKQEDNDLDSQTQYTSMFLSVAGGPSPEYVNAFKDETLDNTVEFKRQLFVDDTPLEMLLNPVPSDQILTIPFNKKPFQEFHITPKSISSKKMFNDKRHLISLYVNGDIKIWDVFICKIVRYIPFENGDRRLSEDELKLRSKEMELIFQQNQSNEVLSNWCEIYIKSGKLLVSLSETYIGNVGIYYDELVKDYPFLKADEDAHKKHEPEAKNSPILSSETCFWIGRIFLASLFQDYCQYERQSDMALREKMRDFASKLKIDTQTSIGDSSSTESEEIPKRKKLFSRFTSPRVKNTIAVPGSADSSIMEGIGQFVLDRLPKSVPDDSIAKMLLSDEHSYKDKYITDGQNTVVDSYLHLYNVDCTNKKRSGEDFRPLIPGSLLPDDLLIIIYETSTNLGNFRDLCSFHLGDLKQLKYSDVTVENQLVHQLRMNIPKWIGRTILYNNFPVKEQPKISVILLETDYTSLLAHQKIGSKSQKKIKKLPLLQKENKFQSHSMLRVGRILQLLTEKFESRTSEMKAKKQATEWLLLECKGQELDPRMTLQTIKTTIWKSGTEIELYYRRKFD